ncbi:MAG: PEGA domain-containing protein, partial [Muribaculaceae bacterium]
VFLLVTNYANSDLTAKQQKEKKVIPMMMVIVVIVGFFIGVASFCMAYTYMMSDETSEPTEERFSANGVLKQAQANLIGSDIDAVVKSIDKEANTIVFYNLKNDTSSTVNVTDTTIFPKNVTMDTIAVGDIYTYKFDKDENITEIKTCQKSWTVEDIGVSINTSAKLIKFSDTSSKDNAEKSYKYVEGLTSVSYKNQPKTLENISPLDYVKIKGYDNGKINRAYSIEILKSHGEIQFQNMDSISNAKIYINDKQYSMKSDSRVLLTEGTYNVKVTGSNTMDITKQVNVVPDNPTVVDLSKIQVKTGVLNISSNVDGYKLYLNDKEQNTGESPLLEYGTYTVKATKDGYKDFTSSVTIDSDTNTLDIKMKKSETGGTLNLNSVPSSAEIYIDGSYAGTGSVSRSVALGSYVVECKADGYNSDKKQINVSADGQVINLTFQLTPAE